jgi:xylan 1,4-beta-xylosidase
VLVARSRSITGPYELDGQPLLTTRDDPSVPLQKAGHAELVEMPGGEWVMSHLTARPVPTPDGPRCTLGRETAIQALTWDRAGWPRLRYGGWHPAVEVDVTTPTRAVVVPRPADIGTGTETGIGTSADAELEAEADEPLGWPWSSLRGYADPSWADVSARPGWIRLRGRHGPESRWAHSLLAQRITEHRAEAEVTVEARPETFTQAAGLVLWYNTEAYLSLDLTWAEPEGEGQHGQQWRGRGRTVLSLVEREEFGTRRVAVVDVDAEGPVTLGVSVDGGEAQFWYVRQGVRTLVGPALDFTKLSDDYGSKLRFTGSMAGIHAVDLVDAAFTADFTGFRLTCW